MPAGPARSPFSGASSSLVWGRKDGRVIYQCPDTGATFYDRTEVSGRLEEDYPYLKGFDAERFEWEVRIRRPKFQRQLERMRRYVDGERPHLLDVGAGPGYLVYVANEEGWSAVGAEVSADAVRYGAQQYGARYVELDEVERESVDALTCHHVLDHVDEPVSFLETLHAKLRPGGLLVLHVSHQQPLTFALRDTLRRLTSGGAAETVCKLYEGLHVSGFTAASLRAVAERGGFETHFTKTPGMWSRYYDPFFFRSLAREGRWGTIARKALRHAAENLGRPFGLGDWVVGYFRKA
ncbi:MAG: class I SAM-dependent methyltransferase [Bacteroidota bacterium]